MSNVKNTIGFVLRQISTEQFALNEEQFSETGKKQISVNLHFGVDHKHKAISVFSKFILTSDSKIFIIIEAGCHFEIRKNAWSGMLDTQTNVVKVSKGFMQHIAMLTVGTTRGILHAKTEGTCFNKYVLPAINVAELIKDDVEFEAGK